MAMDFTHGAVSFGAGLIAGAMNSVAGGGTLLTFPTLIWLGLNSVTAIRFPNITRRPPSRPRILARRV